MDLRSILEKGTKHRDRMRLGRGIGAGNGKTCGRGHKGWGARSGSSRRPGYEGGQMPLYRRVPKRGFKNSRFRTEFTIVNVGALNAFEEGSTVELPAILARGLASMNTPFLKVLGNGELERKLTVRAHQFSRSAEEKIRAAGGEVVYLDRRGRETAEAVVATAEAEEPETQEPGSGETDQQ